MLVRAVIFDLGGTLLEWPDWDTDIERRWGLSYDYLISTLPREDWPDREAYIHAMRAAEMDHWKLVDTIQASSTPTALLNAGFQRLGWNACSEELMVALDGYARAVDGWATVFPDARPTLVELRQYGYRIGLLSNTWWAAEWHNAEIATHGLDSLFDQIAYTSDLPYSKPHPSTFLTMAARLEVEPTDCVMVGDRMVDDIFGALRVGMRAVWKKTDYPWPKPAHITPTATIKNLVDLLPLLRKWEHALKDSSGRALRNIRKSGLDDRQS